MTLFCCILKTLMGFLHSCRVLTSVSVSLNQACGAGARVILCGVGGGAPYVLIHFSEAQKIVLISVLFFLEAQFSAKLLFSWKNMTTL